MTLDSALLTYDKIRLDTKESLRTYRGVMYAQAQRVVCSCHHPSAADCMLNLHQACLLALLTGLA